MTEALVVVEDVVKEYGVVAKTTALRGVSFSIERGEVVALIGPSGSGKSTLLNILGLLDRPTRGRLWLLGHDTAALDDAALTHLRGQSLGFIFQFHHLIDAFDLVDNVAMPLFIGARHTDATMRRRAQALLEQLGLGDKVHERPQHLSGGQQQRVAVARALVIAPALVLADEPTGNLDTAAAAEVFALLQGVCRAQHAGLLVVTHDERLAARCERVIELVDGRVERGGDMTGTPG